MGKHKNRRGNPNSDLGPNRDLSREQEILHSQRHLDPQIARLLEMIPSATESQKLEISLMLQKIARGPASLLERPDGGQRIAQLRHKAAQVDATTEKFEKDRETFIETTIEEAERKLKKTGAEADKIKAKVATELQHMIQDARARRGSDKINMDRLLSTMPKRKIVVTGSVEMIRRGENIIPEIQPEVIRIKHRTFVFPPGEWEVPELVAQVHDERLRKAEEQRKRENVLQAVGEAGRDTEVFKQWDKINEEYGSQTDRVPSYGVY